MRLIPTINGELAVDVLRLLGWTSLAVGLFGTGYFVVTYSCGPDDLALRIYDVMGLNYVLNDEVACDSTGPKVGLLIGGLFVTLFGSFQLFWYSLMLDLLLDLRFVADEELEQRPRQLRLRRVRRLPPPPAE